MSLERELATYQANILELLASEGKYVLIQGDDIAGCCDSYEGALEAGYDRYGLEPFLGKRLAKDILDAAGGLSAARNGDREGESQSAAKIRRTDIRPIPSRRAISAWLTRWALRRRTSRSNSANTASIPAIARPVGVVRSSTSTRGPGSASAPDPDSDSLTSAPPKIS
jgi:hypothetical protein